MYRTTVSNRKKEDSFTNFSDKEGRLFWNSNVEDEQHSLVPYGGRYTHRFGNGTTTITGQIQAFYASNVKMNELTKHE